MKKTNEIFRNFNVNRMNQIIGKYPRITEISKLVKPINSDAKNPDFDLPLSKIYKEFNN